MSKETLRVRTLATVLALSLGSQAVALAKSPDAQSKPLKPVAAAAANPYCPNDEKKYDYRQGNCKWVVQKIIGIPGDDQRPWVDCVKVGKSPVIQHIQCSVAHSTARQVTATLGGKAPVGAGEISASVGYNVTKTTTITTSDTVDVPRHVAGTVQWAAVFDAQNAVKQEYDECVYPTSAAPAEHLPPHCFSMDHPRNNDFATAYTEKYDAPIFRFVNARHP